MLKLDKGCVMANKIMIIGTGNVGSSIAYAMLNQQTDVNELILVDIDTADAEGEVMDLCDALVTTPNFIKIKAGTYADAKDCDIIIITAGVAQQPGETRMDLLAKNALIFKNISSNIMSNHFSGIILVVSNPLDVLTYLTWHYTGLPTEQVIGSGTVLDSARLCFRIAKRLGVSPRSVHALQVGEHGDTEFALWSNAEVSGQLVSELISHTELSRIEADARNRAYEIIDRKGATYYGIGACVTQIVNCILEDECRVLPVSNYDYATGIYNSFPAVVSRQGITRRLDLRLSESELYKLQTSTNLIKASIGEALRLTT